MQYQVPICTKERRRQYALIGLNLGDRQAEEIRHTKTAKEAWGTSMKLNESSTMANHPSDSKENF